MIPRVLLAKSNHDAHTTATLEWHWRWLGGRTYRAHDGLVVERINAANDLRGLPDGTKVFIGHGAKERADWPLVTSLAATGRIELVQL